MCIALSAVFIAMFSTTIYSTTRRTIVCGSARMLSIYRNTPEFNSNTNGSRTRYLHLRQDPNLITLKRFKHSKKKASKHKEQDESDDEDEDDNDNEVEVDEYLHSTSSKIVESKVNSPRLDSIGKAGFKISRNKIEEAFYGSKIRVNGEKVLKKSIKVRVGDEIDMILGRSPENSTYILVNRIVILSIQPETDNYRVKLIRDKSLLIEDYPDPWQGSSD